MMTFCCSECMKCDATKVFDNMDTMEHHLAKEHFKICLFECPSCPNALFATECALVDHTKDKHNRTRVEIAYALDRSAHRARRELLRCLIKSAQQAPNIKPEQLEVPVEMVQNNSDLSNCETELICLSDSETDEDSLVVEEEQPRNKRVKSEPAAPILLSEVAEAITPESTISDASVSLTQRNMKVEGLEGQLNESLAPELEQSRQEIQDHMSSFNLRESFEALMADSTVESSEPAHPAEVSSSEDNASTSPFTYICPKMPLRSEHSISSTNLAEAQKKSQSTFAEPHPPTLGSLQSAQPESSGAGKKRANNAQRGSNICSQENTTSARHAQEQPMSPTFSSITNRSRRRLFSSSSAVSHAGPKDQNKISAVAKQSGHRFSEVARCTWQNMTPAQKKEYDEKEKLERSELKNSLHS